MSFSYPCPQCGFELDHLLTVTTCPNCGFTVEEDFEEEPAWEEEE